MASAAAPSASTFAPGSFDSRKLMIETKPIFLISGTASTLIAPEQETVVSARAKFTMPGTVSLVTSCAASGEAAIDAARIKPAERKIDFMVSLLASRHHDFTRPEITPAVQPCVIMQYRDRQSESRPPRLNPAFRPASQPASQPR